MLISEAQLLYSNLSVSYIGSAGETRHDGTTRHWWPSCKYTQTHKYINACISTNIHKHAHRIHTYPSNIYVLISRECTAGTSSVNSVLNLSSYIEPFFHLREFILDCSQTHLNALHLMMHLLFCNASAIIFFISSLSLWFFLFFFGWLHSEISINKWYNDDAFAAVVESQSYSCFPVSGSPRKRGPPGRKRHASG